MNFDQFKEAVRSGQRPSGINLYLEAMYEDGIGDWESAHNIAQDISDKHGSLIHAYLHRREGDIGNANYWYHRAGQDLPNVSLDEEWESIVRHFLTMK